MLSDFGRAFLRRLQNALPIQEPDRVNGGNRLAVACGFTWRSLGVSSLTGDREFESISTTRPLRDSLKGQTFCGFPIPSGVLFWIL